MTNTGANGPRLHLTGEPDLIRELGGALDLRAFRVTAHPNSAGRKQPLPSGIRAAALPAANTAVAFELTNQDLARKERNLKELDRKLPASVPILSSSVTVTIAEQSRWIRTPGRLAGISAFPTLLRMPLTEIAPGIATSREVILNACAVLHRAGKQSVIVQDRIGMVMPRILCMLANEAFFTAMEGIAEPRSIDNAMKLGTRYPLGPIEWCDRIGAGTVVAVLEALHRDLGEDRYRIAPLLKSTALAAGT